MSKLYSDDENETNVSKADPNVNVTLESPPESRPLIQSYSSRYPRQTYPIQSGAKGYQESDNDDDDDDDVGSYKTYQETGSKFKMFLPLIAAAGVGVVVFFILRPTEKSKGSDGNPLEEGSDEWKKKSRNAMIGAVVAAAIAGAGAFYITRKPAGLTGAERILTNF